MDELENKLGAILGNPEMMEKITAFAQTLGQPESPKAETPPQKETAAFPDIDISMLQKISSLAGQGSIDQNQKKLLQTLRPYLSGARISKLERAMRAARMASMAGIFFGNPSSGR